MEWNDDTIQELISASRKLEKGSDIPMFSLSETRPRQYPIKAPVKVPALAMASIGVKTF